MPIDLDSMTNREMEDVEEYVGRPIMGFIRRAFAGATRERTKEGKDPRTGEPFTETEEYIDTDELMDKLPTKIMNALNCVQRRRKDSEFTIDKWADAVFGDDGTELRTELLPEEGERGTDPTTLVESFSATGVTLSVVPQSSSESNESETLKSENDPEFTPPSVTSTQPTQ